MFPFPHRSPLLPGLQLPLRTISPLHSQAWTLRTSALPLSFPSSQSGHEDFPHSLPVFAPGPPSRPCCLLASAVLSAVTPKKHTPAAATNTPTNNGTTESPLSHRWVSIAMHKPSQDSVAQNHPSLFTHDSARQTSSAGRFFCSTACWLGRQSSWAQTGQQRPAWLTQRFGLLGEMARTPS